MSAPLDKLKINADSAAASTDGYADGEGGTSGEPIALAENVPGDDLAHLVIITPSGSVTGNYTITGLGPNGEAQSEVLATDTTNAVTSVRHYSRVDSVLAPAGIGAETVDIGWTAVAVTPWYTPNVRMTRMNFGVTVVSGTPNYTVQHTFDGVSAFDHADVDGETSSADGSYTGPVQGIRLLFDAAGEVRLTGLQAIY